MQSSTVHTSALDAEPDMFEDAHTETAVEMQLELISDAEVRTMLVGPTERTHAVLVLKLRPLNGFRRQVHAHQVFSEADRAIAERQAATLKKGARITVTTTFRDMVWILPHVQAVALHPAH